MIVIGRKLLFEYSKKHSDTRSYLKALITELESSEWKTPQDIKDRYRTASFLHNNIVVLNIRGNNHRLVVKVIYENGIIKIIWIGTHSEYERIKF